MPQKMRVSNHGEYNKFLEERGNIFHFINEAIENWYEIGPKIQGGNRIYSDKVVILVHIITYLFRIGLRQAVGFIKGCLKQTGKGLKVISYTQSSRRLRELNLKINDCRADTNNMENIEIAIDSTGISIYNNTPKHSGVNSKDRKYRHHDQTRKLHLMLDVNSKKAIDAKYTNGTYSDCRGAHDLLKEVNNVSVLYADGAYDTRHIYQLCHKLGIKTKIPTKKDAVLHPKLDYMAERNTAVRLIRSFDGDTIKRKKQWKKEAGYGKRSYIEAFFSRLKQIFGFSFKNKSEVNREKEMIVKCYLLNKFTDIGMAKFQVAS